jgi:hypothetical protein
MRRTLVAFLILTLSLIATLVDDDKAPEPLKKVQAQPPQR